MFERFTDRARRVLVLAQQEARDHKHPHIDTEHILLGLLAEGQGIAPFVLERLGHSKEQLRTQIDQVIGFGSAEPVGHLPFTSPATQGLRLAAQSAEQLGTDYIGTEHILLGLLAEGTGTAPQLLNRLGVDLATAQQEVSQVVAQLTRAKQP
ncbi:Clp protease N-terminal domain-containing protein [Micromonospora sp. NPDC003197]